jgi:tetratricopeptide (TPR) repeat protein
MVRLALSFLLAAAFKLSGAAQQIPVFDEQTSRHLAEAQQAEKHQDYQAASLQYEDILKQQPKLAIIRQSLAITYHLQNRYTDAISEFQRALQLDPAMWGSWLFLGMDYYKTNQFSLALDPLEKSISLNAKIAEPEARFWLGVTYSALGRPEDAVRELRRDLVLKPGNQDVLYHLIKTYDQAAASAFERLGEPDPGSAAVSLLQAERFMDENRGDLAGLQYRRAVELRPDFSGWIKAPAAQAEQDKPVKDLSISVRDARADLELAVLVAQAGDTQQSIALLQKLVAQKPANAEVTKIVQAAASRIQTIQSKSATVSMAHAEDILKALQLLKEGRFQEAEEPLSVASKVNPNSTLQLLLIRACVEAGDYGKVEDQLRRLLANDPKNVDALLLFGHTYKQQAEATLQRLIQIDSDSYGVHELLGKQHEERTEYEAAIKEYQAALAKRPDLAGIHYAIGNVYRKMKQYDEAEKWLTQELARNPYHGLAHYRLGSIYTEQAKPDAAIPHLLLALQSHPGLVDAQLDLGRAYTAAGKYEEAIAALKHVSHLDADNDRVHYLLSIAYSKEGRRADAQTEMAAFQRLNRDRLERTQQDVKNLSDSLDR